MKKNIIAISAVLLLAVSLLLCACTKPDKKTEHQETHNSEPTMGVVDEKDNDAQENAPAVENSQEETPASTEIVEAEDETTEVPATEAPVADPPTTDFPTTDSPTTNPPVTEPAETILPTEESEVEEDETGEF